MPTPETAPHAASPHDAADELVLWTNPRCSKSRGAEALLAARGVVPRTVRYLDTPPDRAELERVLRLLGTDDPRVLARSGEPLYAELGLAAAGPDAVLDALAAHPQLIERPVALRGGRAVVARPPERVLELLDSELLDDLEPRDDPEPPV